MIFTVLLPRYSSIANNILGHSICLVLKLRQFTYNTYAILRLYMHRSLIHIFAFYCMQDFMQKHIDPTEASPYIVYSL